jgi:O-antigen ligase
MTITLTPPTLAPPERAAAPATPRWRRLASSPAAPPLLGLAAGAVLSAALLLGGVPALLAAAPLALAAVVAGVALAVTRFSLFVLLLLMLRAGVDSVGGVGPLTVNVVLSTAFLVAGLVWVAADVRAGGPRTRTWAPSLALLGACAASLAASSAPSAGVVELLRIASGLLMLEVLQRLVRTLSDIRHLLVAVMLSLVVPVGMGLFQAATGAGALTIADFDRVVGTMRHPNPFAIYLVLCVLSAVALFPHLRLPGRVLVGAVAVPAALALLFTYTRTGWTGLVVGVLVVGVLQSRRLLAGLAALVVAALLLNPAAAARLSDLGATETASGATANSLVWRFQYWHEAVELAEGRPVTGLGLDMVSNTAQEALQPHNDFVRVTAETGVLGLAAYVWLLAALVGTAVSAVRRTAGLRHDVRRGGAVAVAAAVAAVLLMSVTSNVLSQVVLLWYTAAVVGLAAPATRLLSRNGGER